MDIKQSVSSLFFMAALLRTGLLAAQNPETPVIELVSIDETTEKPYIRWQADASSGIDGFIIKRWIFDYQNTYGYNTVHITEDPNAREFIDSTTVYGPAVPDQRSEIYRVAAYDSVGDERFLSPMSQAHATIFLSGEFDYCKRSNHLVWNRYLNSESEFFEYRLFESCRGEAFQIAANTWLPDTFASVVIENFNTDCRYYVEARNTAGLTSRSNTAKIFTEASKFPESIQIQRISGAETDACMLDFWADDVQAVDEFLLLSASDLQSPLDTLAGLAAQGNRREYTFETVKNTSGTARHFRILALDTCPAPVAESQIYTELLISGKAGSKPELNVIEINPHPESEEFDLYRRFNARPFELLASDIPNYYEDDIRENFLAQMQGQSAHGFFSYHAQIQGAHTLYLSNLIRIEHKPQLMKYNAINPKSSNSDNEFKPLTAYMVNYKMSIYHPEGYLIFESSDPQKGWKGRGPDGSIVPRGSYIYYLQYTDASGSRHTEKAIVNVVY